MSKKNVTDNQKDESAKAMHNDDAVLNGQEAAETAQETSESQPGTEGDNQEPSELEKLAAEHQELNDKYLRLAAEFDNYRKRTLKEKAELILNGGEKSITSILPVVDDLERALQNMDKTDDINALKEGVQLVYNKFIQILNQNGVKQIETVDQALDTDFMEAIAVIDAPVEELKGKILDCVQTGYTLNEKVIRHAKVVVGK